MNNTGRGLALALLAVAGAANADDGSSEGLLRQGWYVTPMATYMISDSARCNTDNGEGGALALGHRGDFASLEAWGQYVSASHGTCTYTVPAPTQTNPNNRASVTDPAGDLKLSGGGLAIVLGPFFDNAFLQRFFGLVGFGALDRQGSTQYRDGTSLFGDAGLGYMQPFHLFGFDVAARLEGRYRFDVQQPPYPDEQPGPAHQYQDIIVNLGLQVALSPRPAAAPEAKAEPVSVIPAVAESDTDHDGVPDGKDQCPETPAGQMVDESGCPAAKKVTIAEAKAGDTIVLEGVNFETASSRLTVNAKTILDDVARQLNSRPDVKVEIGGHTDSRGSDSYNRSLSERRAQSVVAYLTEHGVDASRLSAKGYGKAGPVDTNDTDEGRERNRRVELKVLDSGPVTADTTAPTDNEPGATAPDTTTPDAATPSATAPAASGPASAPQ